MPVFYSVEEIIRRMKGKIVCDLEGRATEYDDPALIPGNYFSEEMDIKGIELKDNKIVVHLIYLHVMKNDLNEDWVKDYINENGREPSFF